jgi:hypothetical protein
MVQDRVQAPIIPPSAFIFGERKRLGDLALKHRLLSVGGASHTELTIGNSTVAPPFSLTRS